MEEMNTIEMQAQESAAGTAGYAESTAPAGPEAPPVSYTHLDVYKRQGGGNGSRVWKKRKAPAFAGLITGTAK